MLTLAVETSSQTASCAVAENGKVLSEITTQFGRTHSQQLVPMMKTLMDMMGRSFKDVDLFAAAIGPGSFTGLRIGVVTIKGMAYSLKKPVCGIPTLDALAFLLPQNRGIICPMLDARNNQVFTALYAKKDDVLVKLTDDMGIAADELIEILKGCDQEVTVLGDAAPMHIQRMRNLLGERVKQALPALFYPRASATALLAEKAFSSNKTISAFELEPLYLRKSQAERLRELKC